MKITMKTTIWTHLFSKHLAAISRKLDQVVVPWPSFLVNRFNLCGGDSGKSAPWSEKVGRRDEN